MRRSDYLERKFGKADGGGRYERVVGAARAVGLELRLVEVRADGGRGRLGQAEVPDLAGPDQLLDGAGDVLDRHVRVDAVLVEQVDVVGA